MHPIVLINRTPPGDAFVYSRYNEHQECTDVLQLEPVPIGTALPALSSDNVELFRTNPEKL